MTTRTQVPGVRRRALLGFLAVAAGAVLAFAAARAIAAPPAGTPIGNQASASYLDASSTNRTTTSNLVTTIVAQVASFTLTADGARVAAPGGSVVFPHTVTNTGNGTDTFPITLTNLGGDDFNLTGLDAYADVNGDGVADNFTPITTTGALAAGGVFRFVVVGNVPGTQIGGDVANITVSAVSTFDGSQTGLNTDVTTVSGNAVINITKAINQPSGSSPSGPYTYTIAYTNTGNSNATTLRIQDVIPPGMTYVAGSARWSVTGAAVLTDANAADAQGVAPNTVTYDFGITGAGVTATLNQVAPGASGTLTFQVNVNVGLAPQIIDNIATFTYNDGAGSVGPFTTNIAPFAVNQTVALTFSGQTVASAVQGATISYSNTLVNGGNGSDTFDVTLGASSFPAGTSYTLYQSDGLTPLTDTNGNGTADTGPLAAGGSYVVVLRVTLPPAATGGPFQIAKTATSAQNPAQSATATDVLTTIAPNAVDLTNNAVGGPGVGSGVEAVAVVTNTTNPGTTTRFTLVVANNSTIADNFDLAASTDNTFGSFTLPAGWSVTFLNAGLTPITNTGNVAASGNVLFYADVTVPAGYAAGTTSIFFRARSPVSFAADRLHDAVTVSPTRSLTLIPNNTGQVTPGGVATYTHVLANTGNVAEGDGVASVITLAMVNSQGAWGTALYVDSNNNGSYDVSDAAIADLGSIGGLAGGSSVRLFVRVFSPAGAPLGQVNLTTLSATTTNGTYVSAAPAVVNASDQTTVLNGQLTIVKRQVLDSTCDGVADGSYSTATIATGAYPGVCLRYEIVVTNIGTASVTNVVVDDATPPNTKYTDTVAASTSQGFISTPLNGAAGTVTATVGTLAPGQSATITFGVRIDP